MEATYISSSLDISTLGMSNPGKTRKGGNGYREAGPGGYPGENIELHLYNADLVLGIRSYGTRRSDLPIEPNHVLSLGRDRLVENITCMWINESCAYILTIRSKM